MAVIDSDTRGTAVMDAPPAQPRTAGRGTPGPTPPRRSAGRALWWLAGIGGAALLTQVALQPLADRDGALGALASFTALLWQVIGVVFVFWHGGRRYGAGGIITMFLVTYVISNAYENLSISTGFPFGHYHYTHQGTPFLFQVPATIGVAYFEYGYLAWCVASILLGGADGRLQGWAATLLQPLTAAFVMVMWDLVMDPLNSTIGHSWIWHQGGGYNGVPLTNYLGWYLTVWTVYQVFALIVHARPTLVRAQPATGFWAMPVLLYALTALSFVIGYLETSNREIADATGRSWSTAGISETSVTVMIFTMLFASFLAMIRLFERAAERRRGGGAPLLGR